MSQPKDMDASSSSASDKKETTWKLEESSLWWLSLDFFKHPGNVLLLTSVPFCAGAYLGYRKPTEKLDALVGAGKNAVTQLEKEFGTVEDRRRVGLQTAARAFRLATLGAVGSFGMLSAGT
jgi:hypothetical protein